MAQANNRTLVPPRLRQTVLFFRKLFVSALWMNVHPQFLQGILRRDSPYRLIFLYCFNFFTISANIVYPANISDRSVFFQVHVPANSIGRSLKETERPIVSASLSAYICKGRKALKIHNQTYQKSFLLLPSH